MRRRDFVRTLAAAAAAPPLLASEPPQNPAPVLPAPVPWTLGLNPGIPLIHTTTAESVAEAVPMFFSPAQLETLRRLSDVLMPPMGGKPGALEAATPEFLDYFLAGADEPRRKTYTDGLAWLESESTSRFHRPFKEIDGEQADALLRPWLRTWMSDHPPTEDHADFVNIAHADIRTATVNSRAWSEASHQGDEETTAVGLYWSPIQPDLFHEDQLAFHMRPQPVRH